MRWVLHGLADRLLQSFKLLRDCLMDATLQHDQLALAGAQRVALALKHEDLLGQGVVGLE